MNHDSLVLHVPAGFSFVFLGTMGMGFFGELESDFMCVFPAFCGNPLGHLVGPENPEIL